MGQTKRLAILTAAAGLMMAGTTPPAGAQATPEAGPAATTTSTTNSNSTDASSDDATGTDEPMDHGSPGDDATSHDSPSGDDPMSHDPPSDDATDDSGDPGSGEDTKASGTQADADFVAYVAGSAEVPQTSSTAWAWSEFVVSDDGSELRWSARVFGLDNAVAAHLHLAPKGVNGPIVVPLSPPEEGSGPSDSADISGTITDDDLAGPLAGTTVGDLVDEIEAGNIYLNIHTSDGEDGASMVPGDYPAGEIRGQLVSWPPEG